MYRCVKGFHHSRILVICFFILEATMGSFTSIYGQDLKQTIRGQVLDKESRTPVIGATVIVLGIEPLMGTATDVDGNFSILNVPIGRHTLQISAIGFEQATVPEVLVGSGKEVVLQVSLQESFERLDEIVITADQEKGKPQNEFASVSARSFSVDETKRYAASINDPGRMALSFAGTTSGDDENNEIIIRGNSPRGILWRVEGVEVPNPNHFADNNAGGGGISILSVNVLDNSDFYTGAFPAEYGNASSGVFDLQLRKGNSHQREYAFQAGLLGLDFAAEGPFKQGKNASYLVNYRYSTLGVLDAIGVLPDFGDLSTNFQDLTFKLHFPTEKAGTFSVWGFGGLSNQKGNDALFPEKYVSDVGAGGLTHVAFLSKNTYLQSSVVVSGSRNTYNFQNISENFQEKESFKNQRIRASTMINHKLNSRNTFRAGLIGSELHFDASETIREAEQTFTPIEAAGKTHLWQAYSQWKFRLSPRISTLLGLHTMWLRLNNHYTLESRASIQWEMSDKSSLSMGYGRHSRLEDMSVYFAEDLSDALAQNQPNKNLDFTMADHFVLSYDQFIGKNWHLKLEAYYQHLSQVPIALDTVSDPRLRVYSTLNLESGFVSIPLVNDGKGRNYGLEMTLERFFKNDYYVLWTVSVFESKYTARDGIERDTRFNSNFVTNILAGKEFKVGRKKNNSVGLNGRLLWNGGKRFIPIDLEASQASGEEVLVYPDAYAYQPSDYVRLDLRFSYRVNRPKFSSTLSLDIQNVTGKENVFSPFYDKTLQKIDFTSQLGLIPILNYRMEF